MRKISVVRVILLVSHGIIYISGDGGSGVDVCDETTCRFGGTCELGGSGPIGCVCRFNCDAIRYV